ncbi:FHA domain-containing protein [Chitinivorax sp. B]|uniref:FHA domain-containing protein n=1 Tax=Chitinivorax sp. B TaxID=2502235 RepID=UPI001485BBDD|nr:FHA domain-containing protein [Chitinivorax sp. B]
MLELRILNGLHRGAALVLGDTALVLGSGRSADIMLLDPGVTEQHLQLVPVPDGWVLRPQDGQIHRQNGTRVTTDELLLAGMRYEISGLWLAFDAPDQAWPDALPVVAIPDSQPVRQNARRPRRYMTWLVVAVGCFAAAAWGAAAKWALTETESAPVPSAMLPPQPDQPMLPTAVSPAPAKHTDVEQLSRELHAALRARDLDSKVAIERQPNGLLMSGDLNRDEAASLERLLVKFDESFKPAIEIKALVTPAAKLLPFRIVQVNGGPHASVVTANGDRLYPGDMLAGYRLVEINGGKLRFDGKRALEIVW